jgi:hypothetical protein
MSASSSVHAPTVQVVLDAADPHALAEFWAAVLGYDVEDVASFVQRMLDEGHATEADTTHHRGALVWRYATALSDPAGRRPRLYLQRVPEAKTVKNRVHLDVKVGAERREAEVERLVGMGARRLYVQQQGPLTWETLADPEGNEFCVS